MAAAPVAGADLASRLVDSGYRLATGVPCSYLGSLIDACAEPPMRYVAAVNEGSALAVAAGAEVAGCPSVVLLQNSGLGNLVNPLTSLAVPYRVPLLLFVSMRGWPDPAADEPQHAVMGPATSPILDACGVATGVLTGSNSVNQLFDRAAASRRSGRPFAVLVPRGAVAPARRLDQAPAWGRRDVVAALARALAGPLDGSLVLGGTGYLGRELFAAADGPGHFYLQGAMGHVSSVGVGVALVAPDRTVVVLDGDGAALMHLGALATVGAERLANLVHVVVDNGCYESTGAQATISSAADWRGVALAVGYRSVATCDDAAAFDAALARAAATPGPTMIVARAAPRPGAAPPRASASVAPHELTARFRRAVTGAPVAAGRGRP